MTNVFANPSPPLAEGSPSAPANHGNDLDFSVDVPPLELGLFAAHVAAVRLVNGKLVIDFVLDEGSKGAKVAFWGDPSDRASMMKLSQVVNALGVDLVNRNGSNVPECGWTGLVDKLCMVAVDAYNGELQIPRFGKIRDAGCPAAYKNRDFGCGVLPVGST